MLRITVLTLAIFVSSGFIVNSFATSGPGGVFDTTSDNNANVSFLPEAGNMTFSDNNITTGSEKALNNTIGNTTEFMQPNFDPSKPIREYDRNSSDWNKIYPIPEGRSD